MITYDPVVFRGSSTTIDFGGAATYTLSSTGDIFNPVAIATSGSALVNSFGGFLGIPITPTTNFINRGTVTFGPGEQYTAFPGTTTIPYSNGFNFVGLTFDLLDGAHYGFVEFRDTRLIGYGYNSTPDAAIRAVNVKVPEPASLAVLTAGVVGLAAWRRKRAIETAVA